MRDNTNIIQELIRDEGEVLHAYQDSEGFWTIGIGRMIDERRGGGISHEEAMQMLVSDIEKTERELSRKLISWFMLDDSRKEVLVNMAFNLGTRGLMSFRNMISAVEEGRYTDAAREMKESLWARQVGERALRLAEKMRTGYQE